jgi:nitroreductase
MNSSPTVSDAVATRRSVRRFLSDPVDQAVLARVLDKAQRAPSGGNVQPWNAHVLAGEPLAALIAAVMAVMPQGRAAHAPEYAIYPKELDGVYETRRAGVGEAMYEALGIPRGDKLGRMAQFVDNFRGFGAPVMMLVHTPRYMGPPQWSDIGMWLQTVMLLLREEGLDSCAQESWAMYSSQVRCHAPIPEDHVFFCTLAIGQRDDAALVNAFDVPRAPLAEAITFAGF